MERREDDVFVLGHAEFTMRHPTIREIFLPRFRREAQVEGRNSGAGPLADGWD